MTKDNLYNCATYWLTCDSTLPWNRHGFVFVLIYLFILPILLSIAFSNLLGGFFASEFWLTIVGMSVWFSAFWMQVKAKERLLKNEDCRNFIEDLHNRRRGKYEARKGRSNKE